MSGGGADAGHGASVNDRRPRDLTRRHQDPARRLAGSPAAHVQNLSVSAAWPCCPFGQGRPNAEGTGLSDESLRLGVSLRCRQREEHCQARLHCLRSTTCREASPGGKSSQLGSRKRDSPGVSPVERCSGQVLCGSHSSELSSIPTSVSCTIAASGSSRTMSEPHCGQAVALRLR